MKKWKSGIKKEAHSTVRCTQPCVLSGTITKQTLLNAAPHLDELVVEVVGDVVKACPLVQEDLVDVAPSHRVDALAALPIRDGVCRTILGRHKYLHGFVTPLHCFIEIAKYLPLTLIPWGYYVLLSLINNC